MSVLEIASTTEESQIVALQQRIAAYELHRRRSRQLFELIEKCPQLSTNELNDALAEGRSLPELHALMVQVRAGVEVGS